MCSLATVIGSERGFCGNFNERLIAALEALPGHADCQIVAVGAKLGARLADDRRVVARLASPSVVEEVETVLTDAAGTLNALPDRPASRLAVVCHVADAGDVGVFHVLPWRPAAHPVRAFAFPPLLHGEPRQFLESLTGQYLFAALHEFLCSSLMADNQQRVRHLEAAVRRITDETARIARHCNRLRQEEITEEIEIILLSVKAPC